MSTALQSPELRRQAERAWARHLGHDTDAGALARGLVAGSLPTAFHATARRSPDRRALTIDGVRATHGELDRRAAQFGGWLIAQGLCAGDRVLLAAGTSQRMITGYLGALRAGLAVVLANPSLTQRELQHLLSDSGAALALAEGDAIDRLGRVGVRTATDLAGLDDQSSSLARAVAAAAALAVTPVPGDSIAIVAYTSGTTGRPKAVALSHASLLASIRAAMLAWRWTADDVLVHALPLFHQHGLGGIHATLLAGSSAVVHSRFDAELLCRSIDREQGTVLFAVPAIYERLATWLDRSQDRLDSLRLAVSGSAPLSPVLAARMEELIGQRPLERYGTTESGLDVSNPHDGPRRPGTVGLPLPGVELAIARDGQPLPAGEHGEILLRGPQVFAGYRGDEVATNEAFYPGGWFRTGDLGCVDPRDGYLRITGRLKELIITGGMNVYPREVELVLEESPHVKRAAVVGVPSTRWGEEVVAAVVPAGGSLDAELLLTFARARLASYKCPKRIVVVGELPTNALGKVVARDVRRLVSS